MSDPAAPSSVRTVLILSAHFPPRMSAGVFRVLRFARFLPRFGWRCVVVANAEACCLERDLRLYEQIDPAIEVHRFRCGNVADHLQMWKRRQRGLMGKFLRPPADVLSGLAADLICPDKAVPGIGRLYRIVTRIVRQQRVDAAWITGPPYSWFLVGPRIRRRLGIPVLLDLRDPWTLDAARNAKWLRRWRRPLERRLEHWVFKHVDRVILNTPRAKRDYANAYTDLPPDRWAIVTNGFEPEDLAGIEPEPFNQPVLVHGGMTSDRRTSRYLLEALGSLRRDGLVTPTNFRYVSFGHMHPREREAATAAGVEHLVEFRGNRPHEEVLAALRGADALLLLVARGHEANIPGKLYEYLATGRPILMAGPTDSDAAEVIRRTGSGTVIEIEDVDGFVRFVRGMINGRPGTSTRDPGALSAYTSIAVSGHLARLLDEAFDRSGKHGRPSDAE